VPHVVNNLNNLNKGSMHDFVYESFHTKKYIHVGGETT